MLVLALAASCGQGGVSGPAPVDDPTRITILPGTATAFSGSPTTFVLSGGTGSYIVTSSHQSVIPIAGAVTGSLLTVIPNAVAADTVVTLTVRDTGATPIATATVTVRPGTIGNDITITPSGTQGGNCAPAVCSGGDALVTATLAQGGVPLAGRAVRFEAVSGDFRFITSSPEASVETLDTSTTVLTDATGTARARIRVFAGAGNQTALLQITDIATGSFQRTSFVIAQATGTSPGFFVSPQGAIFQGSRQDQCAGAGVSATFFIFGGTAPYTISSTSSAFDVAPLFVGSSGGSFRVTPTGQCVDEPGAPIIVRDAAGRTTTVTVANIRGTDAVPALVVGPSSVTLSSCQSIASVTASGGTGNYVASSGSGSVHVLPNGRTFSIFRLNPSAASSSPVNVAISDGTSTANVTVNLTGEGAGACPPPGLRATPSQVVLLDCTNSVQVTLTGGSGTYSVASNDTRVSATVSSNVVSIRRTVPSGAFLAGERTTVTASDGTSTTPITVAPDGAGSNVCS